MVTNNASLLPADGTARSLLLYGQGHCAQLALTTPPRLRGLCRRKIQKARMSFFDEVGNQIPNFKNPGAPRGYYLSRSFPPHLEL